MQGQDTNLLRHVTTFLGFHIGMNVPANHASGPKANLLVSHMQTLVIAVNLKV